MAKGRRVQTGYDGQSVAKVCQPKRSDIDSIDRNVAVNGLYKTEE
jgi:hypothetical protein